MMAKAEQSYGQAMTKDGTKRVADINPAHPVPIHLI